MPGLVLAKNLARDPQVVQRVKDEYLPLLKFVRDDRSVLRDAWLRYLRIWGNKREHAAYHGRYQTYIPIGRRLIENYVTRVRKALFPDADWFGVKGRRVASEDRVPAV